MIVLGEPHLRRILTKYAAYYNELRTHRSFDETRHPRAIQRIGCITHMRSSVDFITIVVEF